LLVEPGFSAESDAIAEFEAALRRVAAAIDALPSHVDAAPPAVQVWYAVLHRRLEDVRVEVARLADITQRTRAS